MDNISKTTQIGIIPIWLFSPRWLGLLGCLFFGLIPSAIQAEGVADLMEEGDDPVMLLVGEQAFGFFAQYGSAEYSRLNIRVADPNEVVYIGLAGPYRFNGTPQGFGSYFFRIRRVSDNQIVHGPIIVNQGSENLSSLAQAALGPEELNAGGYSTDNDFRFEPDQVGDYYIEFSNVSYIGLWDITVANNGQAIPGRIFSKNWAFRVPEPEPQLPDCVWGGELNAQFYSYTSDGFVTKIDFVDSGFQPLSFSLAFNRTGPGATGDAEFDRQSIANANLTSLSAEHLIFLSEPDPTQFVDGVCGSASVESNLQCNGPDNGYCIPVEVTVPGQVELILDFNANGIFDDSLDVILIHTFNPGEELTTCVLWDGLLGNGSLPGMDATVDLIVNYTQGVQHWALFDGEFMSEGFCVEPVRPICGDGGPAMLYYDDRNISDDPGTSAPKDMRQGCPCGTPDCRTWDNFDAITDDCSDINDAVTTGYGDKNTLNTWWFASISTEVNVNMPIFLASVSGPDGEICPGSPVEISLVWSSPQAISLVEWTGPSGLIIAAPDALSIMATEAGMYDVLVTDESGCQFTDSYVLQFVNCSIEAELLGVGCNDSGTDLNFDDDVFYATVRVSGGGAAGWVSDLDGSTGDFGATLELGPFLIVDGDVNISFTDLQDDCCVSSVFIPAPLPCSDGCAITNTQILNNLCHDAGTPLDPTDDTFSFEVQLSAINGSSWTDSEGNTGNYEEPVPYGPYAIADGQVQLSFVDNEMPECASAVTVTPPGTCSDSCYFEMELVEVYCDDSGSPTNPFDDVFYFELSVSAVNATSLAYTVEGLGLGLFGQSQVFGPFVVANGDLQLEVSDVSNPDCAQLLTVVAPPSCSNECGLEIVDIIPNCDDLGTPEITDDLYFYDILVNSSSVINTTWVASDGASGEYGEYVRVSGLDFSEEERMVIITDATNSVCSDTVFYSFPEPEFDCPPEVNTMPESASFQSIQGTLEPGRYFFNQSEELSCWLDQNELEPGGRAYDRFTLNRPDTTSNPGPQLFTFYLFTDVPNAGSVGAVFQLDNFEEIDCCDLANPGPVTRWQEDELQAPFITEEDYPEGLELAQEFSLLLYEDRPYTVVTTTWAAEATGTYRWLIVSTNSERLEVDNPLLIHTMSYDQNITFDLQTIHLPLALDQDVSTDFFGRPTLEVGCGIINLSFVDEPVGDCDSITLFRRFDAQRFDGIEEGVCVQKIGFGHMGLEDIILPPQGFLFTCSDTFPALPNGNPDPEFTGYPTIYFLGETIILREEGYGDFTVSYVDEDVIREDGGRNVYRTWTLTDLCKDETMDYTQLFKLDAGGTPRFNCPTANHYCPILEGDIMLFPTDTFSCDADVLVPLPELENICDTTNWDIHTLVYQLNLNGDTITIANFGNEDEDRLLENLPVGDYYVRYTGTHPNHDPQDITCIFRVADVIEPVAVCKSSIDLPLTGVGTARLYPHHLNRFSYDNCGIVDMQLRRQYFREEDDCTPLDSVYWGEWMPFVEFNCCDAGSIFSVELLVVDSVGLTNFCTAQVNVYDDILPYCTGLEDLTISCEELSGTFNPYDTTSLRLAFGMPDVIDNCSSYAMELAPIVTGDACMPEQITRRFQAVDQNGNLAAGIFTQIITVIPSLNYSILFPRDTESDCVILNDTVRLEDTGCDNLEVTYVDELLDPLGDECRRIARTFTVTNWCEWNGVDEAIVISRDEDCNGMPGGADVWVIRSPDTTFIDANADPRDNSPAEGVRGTFCDGNSNPEGYWRITESTGRWTYTQYIRYFDNEGPSIEVVVPDTLITTDLECSATATIEINLSDACDFGPGTILVGYDLFNDGEVDATINEFAGEYPNLLFVEDFPIGNHRLIISATDFCGNTSTDEVMFTVYDGFVPELECFSYRVYDLEQLIEPIDIDGDSLLEEAAVAVQAVELGNCLFDDCSGDLIYSINRVGELVDRNQDFLYLDCDDRYQMDLEIYVWDDAFNPYAIQPDGTVGGPNWRTCTVTVFVQDPNLACDQCATDDALTVAGRVRTVGGTRMEGVEVSLEESGLSDVTPSNGRYQFQVQAGLTDVVVADKNDDIRSGLNTLDLIILRRHLLQIEPITDPFRLIAADINADGEINILDQVELQSVLLYLTDEFSNNRSWRFVPAEWDGTGEPAEVQIVNLIYCDFDEHFRGIKIGDLNASVEMGNSLQQQGQARSSTMLSAMDVELEAGEVYELSMNLAELENFQGGQLSLSWSPAALELLEVKSEVLAPSCFNQGAKERGRLWLNWADQLASDELLVLRLMARRSLQMSDVLQLCSDCVFSSEQYIIDDQRAVPLQLSWTASTEDTPPVAESNPSLITKDQLMGAFPNPVESETEVVVRIVEAQRAQLQVFDELGRPVTTATLNLETGVNRIPTDARDWANGWYSYRIELKDGTLSGRLLKQATR
ncbi:MAG: T9SS type A sorting domain-containing protein [Bacteroidota bacterium]